MPGKASRKRSTSDKQKKQWRPSKRWLHSFETRINIQRNFPVTSQKWHPCVTYFSAINRYFQQAEQISAEQEFPFILCLDKGGRVQILLYVCIVTIDLCAKVIDFKTPQHHCFPICSDAVTIILI